MDISYINEKKKQLEIDIKKINKQYDILFNINNNVSNYLKINLVKLRSKIKPIYKFWNFPNKDYTLYFTKSRALDIVYSNSLKVKLNNLIDSFPILENEPLNYEFYINQDNFCFTVDLETLLNCLESVLKEFNKESTYSYKVEDEFVLYNRTLNIQKNNFNNLKLLIEKKLVIYDENNNFSDYLYKDYPNNCNKIEEILEQFSLFSKILLELFHLQKEIDNYFKEWVIKYSTLNAYDNYLNNNIDTYELEKQLIISMLPKNTK